MKLMPLSQTPDILNFSYAHKFALSLILTFYFLEPPIRTRYQEKLSLHGEAEA